MSNVPVGPVGVPANTTASSSDLFEASRQAKQNAKKLQNMRRNWSWAYYTLWVVGAICFLVPASNSFTSLAIFIAVLSAILYVGLFIGQKSRENLSKMLEQQAKSRGEEERRLAALESLIGQLNGVRAEAIQWKDSIPVLVAEIGSCLDGADHECQRGAFSPFWAQIEAATTQLGKLSDCLNRFQALIPSHEELVRSFSSQTKSREELVYLVNRSLDGSLAFPVQLRDFYVAEQGQTLALRMNELVDRVSTDYQFSTIYEQRRNTSVMIAGFTNLGSAIAGLESKITNELAGVVRAVDNASRDVVGAIDSASAVASAHSAEAHSMLRNIEKRHTEGNQTLRNIDKQTSPWSRSY